MIVNTCPITRYCPQQVDIYIYIYIFSFGKRVVPPIDFLEGNILSLFFSIFGTYIDNDSVSSRHLCFWIIFRKCFRKLTASRWRKK